MPRRRIDDEDPDRYWKSDDEEYSKDDDEEDDEEYDDLEGGEDEDEEEDGALDEDDDDDEYAEGATGLDELDAMLEEGESLAERGELAEAIEVFSAAAENYPESPLSHYNLGVAHFMKLKEDLEEQAVWENFTDEEGHYEEAVASFERALEVDPEHVPEINTLGMLFALRDRSRDAIKLWKRSLEIDPDQSDVRQDVEDLQSQLDD